MIQLSYCTNVHPAEDVAGVLAQLDDYAGPIRKAAGLDSLGVGLWLSAPVAAELVSDPGQLAALRERLAANRLEVRTLNAFPFQGFHDDVVKQKVYLPTWAAAERAAYTIDCARVLAELMPKGTGSISTLPLAWREGWTDELDRAAVQHLGEVSDVLRALREATGKSIRLAIEPEPGCVLDNVDDLVGWLAPKVAAGHLDGDLIGVCLDTCHLAVSFASAEEAIRQIRDNGLQVFKLQVSAALEADDPSDPAQREALARFVEARYLHQTREQARDGTVRAADDLPEALAGLPGDGPWRVHFHVPVHLTPQPPLRSTNGVIAECVRALATGHSPSAGSSIADQVQVDVETYTWGVLPPETADLDLVAGIAGEVTWVHEIVQKEWI